MTDVHTAVIGAGGAGLAAALRVDEFGHDVVVIDGTTSRRDCNTHLSSCMIPAAGTAEQRRAGIEDSSDKLLSDILTKSGGTSDRALAEALAEVSSQLVRWLRHRDVPLELVTDFRYPGHAVPRCFSTPNRTGGELLAPLLSQANGAPHITIMAPRIATGLERRRDDWCVTMQAPDGASDSVTCRNVVLATGGFAANREMIQRYVPETVEAEYVGSACADGTSLRLGSSVGAQLRYLDAYQGHGAVSVAGVPLTWATVTLGAVLVNGEGARFADESVGYSEFAANTLAQPNRQAWVILDERIATHARRFEHFRTIEAGGGIRTGLATLGEVAECTGASYDVVKRTFAEIGHAAARGTRDRFGRSWSQASLLASPYLVAQVRGGLVHTQGGLAVDGQGRVCGAARIIPRLWAAGGAAMGVSGHGSGGYLAGNGLLAALGLGYLAGNGAGAS